MTTITDSTLSALRERFGRGLASRLPSTSAGGAGMPGSRPTTSASSCGRCWHLRWRVPRSMPGGWPGSTPGGSSSASWPSCR